MGYTILIVDDSATTRAIIKRTIGLAGVAVDRILEAANGRDGLAHAAANGVDLVLADLHMPEMDGQTMIRHLREDARTRDVPVVIISAEPNVQHIETLKAMGISGHLRKPFTPEAVRDLVGRVLEVAHA